MVGFPIILNASHNAFRGHLNLGEKKIVHLTVKPKEYVLYT